MNNSETAELNSDDKEQQAFLHKYVLNEFTFNIMVVGAVFMTGLAYMARKKSKFDPNKMWVALGEMMLFGAANAFPYYEILKARGATDGITTKALRMGGLFCFGYAVLENGGFFNHVFDVKAKPAIE